MTKHKGFCIFLLLYETTLLPEDAGWGKIYAANQIDRIKQELKFVVDFIFNFDNFPIDKPGVEQLLNLSIARVIFSEN